MLVSCSLYKTPGRSEFLYRDRLGLSAEHAELLADDAGGAPLGPPAPAMAATAFEVAWRNYIKTVLKKGFMYKLSISPSSIFYISENKTLAGKEDRNYEGEAMGRKLAVVFFEHVPDQDLVRRVDRTSLALKPVLLTIAELLQTCGFALPHEPERSSAATELLLEAQYQHLELSRFVCTIEPMADSVHMYSLSDEANAESAFAFEVPPDSRTKMILARALQRQGAFAAGETLPSVWSSTLPALKARAAPLFPAPPVPPAPVGRGRGRGRGRG